MSEATGGNPTTGEPAEADQLRDEIAETREELGDTVEAIADKVDVKAQAQQKAEEAKARVEENPVPVAAIAGGIAVAFVLLVVLKKRRG
jgi:hypothetical protein